MDWSPKSYPFLHFEDFDPFEYGFSPRYEGQVCKVIETDADGYAKTTDLLDSDGWKQWLKSSEFIQSGKIDFSELPANGFTILCIPRVKDIQVPNGKLPSSYSDLPIGSDSKESFQEIIRAFHLPAHFSKVVERKQTSLISALRAYDFSGSPEELWMQTAVVNPDLEKRSKADRVPGFDNDPHTNSFAMASTYFQGHKHTFALVLGCSDKQIVTIEGLLDTFKDAVGHPLLMLGVYAELQLDRLDTMVTARYLSYETLMEQVETVALEKGKDRFSWGMIKKVRTTREVSRRVEEEVDETRRQLSKAQSLALGRLEPREGKPADKDMDETTDLFAERLSDIATRLGGLATKCRFTIEDISFTTDIIRSELSRQEAQSSAENSKFATGISLVAMIYLPLTTMATIFAMPIFQWSNDWRDWRYRPVDSGNTSSGSDPGGSADGTQPPVVSGYIWIYLAISIGLTFTTFFGFRLYMELRNHERGTPISLILTRVLFFGSIKHVSEKAKKDDEEKASQTSVVSSYYI
ncbi:hypothetical protein M426DRAFT_326134 [Hypoxylon sp. CI-4A]|nr:hypothetical protein M426DRAFT_326134 [Hypoxylon sp. CI-4A]